MTTSIIGPEYPKRLMWEMSLGEFLDAAVKCYADNVFVEIADHKVTYRQFQQGASQTAGLFQRLGVGKGDRVALFLPNCLEFLYCWFGLSLLGAISVPINTAYKRDETAYILNDSEAVALLAHESLLPVAAEATALARSVKHKLVVETSSPGPLSISDGKRIGGEARATWASFADSLVRETLLPSSLTQGEIGRAHV